MFQQFFWSKTRVGIADISRNGILNHQELINSSKIRVKKILTTYSSFLDNEPIKFIENLPTDIELELSPRKMPELSYAWKHWHLWANKFNQAIKQESSDFALGVHSSGAYFHSDKNRHGINDILDTVYSSALLLRTASQLVYTYVSPEERREVSICNLLHVLHRSIEDFGELCISTFRYKFHVNFEVDENVKNSLGVEIIAIESQLRFVFVELMKNSAKSVIRKHGKLLLDDAHAFINVKLAMSDTGVMVTIEDEGVGMTEEDLDLASGYFYTTDDKDIQSVTVDCFGVPFTSVGFGVPRAKVYLDFNGGDLSLQSKGKGVGAVAIVNFGKQAIYGQPISNT